MVFYSTSSSVLHAAYSSRRYSSLVNENIPFRLNCEFGDQFDFNGDIKSEFESHHAAELIQVVLHYNTRYNLWNLFHKLKIAFPNIRIKYRKSTEFLISCIDGINFLQRHVLRHLFEHTVVHFWLIKNLNFSVLTLPFVVCQIFWQRVVQPRQCQASSGSYLFASLWQGFVVMFCITDMKKYPLHVEAMSNHDEWWRGIIWHRCHTWHK